MHMTLFGVLILATMVASISILTPLRLVIEKMVGYQKGSSLGYSQLKFMLLFVIHFGNLKLVNN